MVCRVESTNRGSSSGFERGVVAEGVENVNQLRILRELGVDHAQGYLFALPEPLEKLDAMRLSALVNIDQILDGGDATRLTSVRRT